MKKYFAEIVRALFMSEPVLYGLWNSFFDKRKNKRNLPKASDKYFVDGYPRSGNTFTKGFIHYCYPDIIANHHFHTIAPLKMALNYKLKILVLFRDPVDSISSLVLMEDFEVYKSKNGLYALVKRRLQDYIRFYRFVIDNIESIHLLSFSKITSHDICSELEKYFELPFGQTDYKAFLNINENVQKGKSAHFSMLPNEKKNSMKENVKVYIYESTNFDESKVIFRRLQELVNENPTN